MSKKNLYIILAILFTLIGMGLYFYQNYKDDRLRRNDIPAGIIDLRTTTTKLEVDNANLRVVRSLVSYISHCKRFPENLEEIFKAPKESVPRGCTYLKAEGVWINPWGHPYEIRYDRERRKAQIRSLGRYWWWAWDNIQDETNMAIPKVLADEERAKCDRGEECVFSRGWH